MGSQKNNFNLAATSQVEKPHRRKARLLTVAAHTGRQPDPAGGRFSISAARRMVIARQRLETLRRFSGFLKNHSTTKAARMAGSSVPTIWRWQKQLKARGLAGLLPKTSRCGRHSPFAKVRLTAAAVRELEMLHVEHAGNPRAAWQKFAKSPSCPPLIARAVQRSGKAPAPLIDIGRVGQVQARCYASTDNRRLFIKLPAKGVLTAQIAVPAKFKLVRLKK